MSTVCAEHLKQMVSWLNPKVNRVHDVKCFSFLQVLCLVMTEKWKHFQASA